MPDSSPAPGAGVALRKESVDRNIWRLLKCCFVILSLSARRAWIEISGSTKPKARRASLSARRAWIEIALLMQYLDGYRSLSARRAWIEIIWQFQRENRELVALRKESVDRNVLTLSYMTGPPLSLSARRAWIEIPGHEYNIVHNRCRSPQGERG